MIRLKTKIIFILIFITSCSSNQSKGLSKLEYTVDNIVKASSESYSDTFTEENVEEELREFLEEKKNREIKIVIF